MKVKINIKNKSLVGILATKDLGFSEIRTHNLRFQSQFYQNKPVLVSKSRPNFCIFGPAVERPLANPKVSGSNPAVSFVFKTLLMICF